MSKHQTKVSSKPGAKDQKPMPEVAAAFRDEGIAVHTGCTLTDARAERADKVIVYEQAGKTCEVRAEAAGRVLFDPFTVRFESKSSAFDPLK